MQTALAILLPINLAWFGLFGKYAFDMRRDRNYRASWGWFFWAISPGLLSALYLTSDPGVSVELRNVVLGSLGAAGGMCAAIWLGYLIQGEPAGAQSTPGTSPSTVPSVQQNNQGPGQQFNAPGGSIYVNPLPQTMPDSGIIQQAGASVGNAFGARRSPTDATRFEFVEITHAEKLNTAEPIVYQGIKMKITYMKGRSGLDVTRSSEGTILTEVIAKIME